MEVLLVPWPADATRRDELAARGEARLLLVDDGAEPPETGDCLEDWIRVPASELDLRVRLAALEARALAHSPAVPSVDGDGLVRFGDEWVALPPVEARLTGALIERFGSVVGRDTLSRAGWPAGSPGRNALDVHVLRLRRRVAPVGLSIRTVRSRGYLLEPAPQQKRDRKWLA